MAFAMFGFAARNASSSPRSFFRGFGRRGFGVRMFLRPGVSGFGGFGFGRFGGFGGFGFGLGFGLVRGFAFGCFADLRVARLIRADFLAAMASPREMIPKVWASRIQLQYRTAPPAVAPRLKGSKAAYARRVARISGGRASDPSMDSRAHNTAIHGPRRARAPS